MHRNISRRFLHSILDDAFAGKDPELVLKPFDTIRVFGRFDFEDPPMISVTGEVRDPGDHVTNGATYLRDAIYLAGSTTPDAQLDDVQVFRKPGRWQAQGPQRRSAQGAAWRSKARIFFFNQRIECLFTRISPRPIRRSNHRGRSGTSRQISFRRRDERG